MNVVQLRYLVAAVRAGSFARAAEELYITPQALSKAIGILERTVGVPLLIKGRKGVEPTPFCLEVVRRSERALADLDDLDEFVEAYGKRYRELQTEKARQRQ